MSTPIIKRGSIQLVYKQWLTEKFPKQKVMALEFLGFRYKQNRFLKHLPKPFYTPEKEAYIIELWLCQDLKSGKKLECKFRHPVATGREETTLSYNRDAPDDSREVNLLTDTLDEYYKGSVNKRIHPNKQLRIQNKKLQMRIQRIEELLEQTTSMVERTGLFLMLRQKQSPTLDTFNSILKWKNENKDVYDQLLIKINNYETNQNDFTGVALPFSEQ